CRRLGRSRWAPAHRFGLVADDRVGPVGLAKNNARNSLAVLDETFLQLRNAPLPFEGMGVEAVVIPPNPRRHPSGLLPASPPRHMPDELLLAAPRAPFCIMQLPGRSRVRREISEDRPSLGHSAAAGCVSSVELLNKRSPMCSPSRR